MGVTDAQRKEYLRKYRVEIIETLILKDGLLDDMHANGVLKKRQVTAIKGRRDVDGEDTNATSKLIDDFLSKCDLDKYNQFLDLMEKDEQMDLVNLLRGKQDAATHEGMFITLSDAPMEVPSNVNREKYEELQRKAKKDENFMYKMDIWTGKPRGMALIINVQHIDDKRNTRHGTDVDRDNLLILWRDFMHFKVTTYNDKDGLTAQGILCKVKGFSEDPQQEESQAIVVCVLAHGTDRPKFLQKILVLEKDQKQKQKEYIRGTHAKHGQEGYIQGTDRILVPLKEIYSYFSNANTIIQRRVPRLFFIQACRGKEFDKGVDRADACPAEDEDEEDEDDADVTVTDAIKRPTHTDYFLGLAAPLGQLAYRNEGTGSWYITALVKIFYENAHEEDLAAMHSLVNHSVAERKANCPDNKKLHGAKTIPECHSNLTKAHLYFFP